MADAAQLTALPRIALKSIQHELAAEEMHVLSLLQSKTYDEIAQETGWSRGRIYALALKTGARKTEARIRERAKQRQTRQLETLAEMINQPVKADVSDYLESLPSGCARLICTSIPYNVGKSYGDAAGADRMKHIAYLGWLLQILSECSRILMDGGTLFLQVGSTRDDNDRLIPLDVLLFEWIAKCKLDFQSRVIWTIPHGLTPTSRLAERHETALVFSKGKPIFNATPARVPQKQPGKRAFKGPNKGELSGNPLGAWPSNVWSDIGNLGHNHPEKTSHPAAFPLALARRAVLLYSMPGDLVIDPFLGSGTTAEAALRTGRAFSGCDLFYHSDVKRRLANAFPDTFTPLPGVTDESVAVWQAEARRVDVPASGDQLDLI